MRGPKRKSFVIERLSHQPLVSIMPQLRHETVVHYFYYDNYRHIVMFNIINENTAGCCVYL